MQMRGRRLVALLVFALGLAPGLFSQNRRAPSQPPQINVESYDIRLELDPDAHELKATAIIKFRPIQTTDVVIFQISENLAAVRVAGERNEEIDFSLDDPGPGNLSVRFASPIGAGTATTIKIEYSGGFDQDRFSRNYTPDPGAAYIGMEGSYLLYPAKWFPVGKLFGDRPLMTVTATVPLGMTAIGPGTLQSIVTQETTETFGWTSPGPVTSASIVAGRYYERKLQFDSWTISAFAREDHIEAIRKAAEVLIKPLDYYRQMFGEPAAGKALKLVEVDDKAASQSGTLGTIFVTHRELTNDSQLLRSLARRAASQWWMDSVGIQGGENLWLTDGMAYYSAALFLGQEGGPQAFRDEIDNLAVLGLKYESKAAVRNGLSLGYGSDAYQSVVAGKGAYILNMLRGILGQAKFTELLQAYAKQTASAGGSTAEFQKLAEKISGKELAWFFAEWIETTGVPNFQVDYTILKTRDGFRISGSIKQDRDLFRMPIEIEAQGQGKTERVIIDLNGRSTPFDINTFGMPEKVIVDPDSKLLRDSEELQYKVQLTLGMEMSERKDYVEAVRAFEQAIKINPQKSIAHYRMAETFFEQMNLQASANTFRDALNGDKEPKWVEVWSYIYIGKIYDILGQRQRALAEYSKALNTKDNTNGAMDEAKKWTEVAYARDSAASDVRK